MTARVFLALVAALPLASLAHATQVTFRFRPTLDGVARVSVAGTFNQWNTSATPLADSDQDGLWETTFDLTPGRHDYKFVVNGDLWFTDVDAAELTPDGYDGENSVLQVGMKPMVVGTPAGDPFKAAHRPPKRIARLACDTYRAAGPKVFHGRMITGSGDAKGSEVSFEVAQGAPDRWFADLGDKVRVYSDGQQTTIYRVDRNRYLRRPLARDPRVTGEPAYDLLLAVVDPLPWFLRLNDPKVAVRYVRRETIRLGGKSIVCDVLEEVAGRNTQARLWIDPVRARLVKSELSGADAVGTFVRMEYDLIRLGAPLPDSLFTFVPPPGAELFGDLVGKGPRQTPDGVEFVFHATGQTVHLAADFNAWSTTADPMTRSPDGAFRLVKRLNPGMYQYKFVVDGQRWEPDPAAKERAPDGYGAFNSVLVVK